MNDHDAPTNIPPRSPGLSPGTFSSPEKEEANEGPSGLPSLRRGTEYERIHDAIIFAMDQDEPARLWYDAFLPQIEEAFKMLTIDVYQRNHLLLLARIWFEDSGRESLKGED